MEKDSKHYPTAMQSIGLSLRLIVYSLIFGLGVVLIKSLMNIHAKPGHSIISVLGYVATMSLIIWIGFNKYRQTEGESLKLKFNKIPIQILLVCIVMILMVSFIVDPLSLIFPPTGIWKKMFEDMTDTSFYTTITVVIAAPILEEIFFRGIILDGLMKNISPWAAIFTSAALFGVIHLNMWQALPAFLAGILIGYLYWKTNSLIPGIVLHFTNNLFCVLVSLKFTKMNWFIILVGTDAYILSVICAFIIFIAGAIYLNWFFTKHPLSVGLEPVNLPNVSTEYLPTIE